jgi:16S rRNA (guanine527-N7)-methyltransferase
MIENAGRQEFVKKTVVSRETMAQLDTYAALLEKWNPAINLVSKASVADAWNRHFLDSAQIFELSKVKSGHWVDIGTGGGFPGMVVAIMAKELAPDLVFTFVESDQRKCTFLRTVSRETNVPITVISQRIEDVTPLNASILSARALAPLVVLLGFADQHLQANGQALFQKGASYRQEVKAALETWVFQSEECRSITDDAAVILSLGDIRRV